MDGQNLGPVVHDIATRRCDGVKTGLEVGKAPFLAAIKQNICGKVERTLLPDTLEVYALKGFGAVELGIHRFHQPGRPEDGMRDAKFVTLVSSRT
jgi:hypothetical protein